MAAQSNSAVTSLSLMRHCQRYRFLNYQSSARGLALTSKSSRTEIKRVASDTSSAAAY